MFLLQKDTFSCVFFLSLCPHQSLVNVTLQFCNHSQAFFIEALPTLLPIDDFPRLFGELLGILFLDTTLQLLSFVFQILKFFVINCLALFLSYRPRTTECRISQLCDTNCYSGRSKYAWALNRWKNFQNHLYGQPVLTVTVLAVASVWMNINRVTLQHNKEFIMFIFYFKTV